MPLLKMGALAQLAPSATTETTLYTCPALATLGTKEVWVRVVNRSTATTFRIRVRRAGEADANKQYEIYDAPIPAAATAGAWPEAVVPLGALEPSDIVEVYAGSANLSFALHGEEWQR